MKTDPRTQPVHYSKLVEDKSFFSGRIPLRPRGNFLVPSVNWKDREAGIVRAIMTIHLCQEFRTRYGLMLLDEGVSHFTEAETMADRLVARTREWVLDPDESGGLHVSPGKFDYHARRFAAYVGIWLSLELTPRELKDLSKALGMDINQAPSGAPRAVRGWASTKYRI
jgi:hypothetical protein